jgi:adenosylmethionine-8-amino-7-oxononanoate aminotransferase
VKVMNTNRYRCASCEKAPACTLDCADDIERKILAEGPETVAAVVLEPMQNTGGALTPPEGYFARVREICDKHGVLLVSDEVICAFGRLGEWFGCQRYGYQPDMITFAKGVTSGYAPLGGVIASDRLAAPFLEGDGSVLMHGLTFGGHPVSCAVALANLDVMEREDILGNVRRNEEYFGEVMEGLRELPLVGDIRGAGYFRVVELVKDKETKESFTPEECNSFAVAKNSPSSVTSSARQSHLLPRSLRHADYERRRSFFGSKSGSLPTVTGTRLPKISTSSLVPTVSYFGST